MGLGEGMRVEHPEAAAGRVTTLVTAIAAGLDGFGKLSRAPEEMSPQPCDHVDEMQPVATPDTGEGNPFENSWYVDYSPYTMLYIGYADVASPSSFPPLISRLRDRLGASGWRPREVTLEAGRASLVIEAPEDGYGARILGVTSAARRARVAVYVSSPCLRHPDAEPGSRMAR